MSLRLRGAFLAGAALAACANSPAPGPVGPTPAEIALGDAEPPPQPLSLGGVDPQVAVGRGHTCVRRAPGHVWCWGLGTRGQLGDGKTIDRASPAAVAGITDAVQISAGNMHTCALRMAGQVVCWGANESGQLGDGTKQNRTTPMAVLRMEDAVQIEAGTSHTCAVRRNGEVWCWGSNAEGQMGDGTTADRLKPGRIGLIDDALEVSAGAMNSCARRSNGVSCWGPPNLGLRGDGSRGGSPAPVLVAKLTDSVQISVGFMHACAVRSGGDVVCWGSLGSSTQDHALVPVPIAGVTEAVQVVAGAQFSCALQRAGTVVCWGNNSAGELGRGEASPNDKAPPEAVFGLSDAVRISGGFGHVCVVNRKGNISCWGDDTWGQLGVDAHARQLEPVDLEGPFEAAHLSIGASLACGATRAGTVSCWTGEGAPTPLKGLADVVQLTGGSETCALKKSGGVACFAKTRATASLCGHDSTKPLRPDAVRGIADAVHVASSSTRACAVRKGGQVVCWRDVALVGDQPQKDAAKECAAIAAKGVTDATRVAVGKAHACARTKGGEVSCWEGQGKATPVAGLADVLDVVAGDEHTCALKQGGGVSCWGDNKTGALGNGTFDAVKTPVDVIGLTDATALAAGTGTTCALRATGGVVCWGSRDEGALGDGADHPSRAEPKPVAGITDAVELAVSGHHGCALRKSGALACWGTNADGAFGGVVPVTYLAKPTGIDMSKITP